MKPYSISLSRDDFQQSKINRILGNIHMIPISLLILFAMRSANIIYMYNRSAQKLACLKYRPKFFLPLLYRYLLLSLQCESTRPKIFLFSSSAPISVLFFSKTISVLVYSNKEQKILSIYSYRFSFSMEIFENI